MGEESSRTTTTAGVVPTTATTTYDPAGHTARVDQPGAAPDVDYVYDTADRLVARTEGLDTTLYFYSPAPVSIHPHGSVRVSWSYFLGAGTAQSPCGI
ncbi:MAG TPA: hypothetical protein VM142_06775 [Acidimicrobiales bacterium]|nr:hypothetical protein [Acidimicrobiales bacterium]